MQSSDTKQGRYSRRQTSEVADIGDIPEVVNPERKRLCSLNLHKFLAEYFPHTTGLLPFSDSHIESIVRIQTAILEGGRYLTLFPRGFGKTTISENSILWATLYGHRRFVPFFGADERAAKSTIESLIREITENDLLFDDFPEICHPFRELEGKVQRCHSQTYQGELTHIRQTADTLVLPNIPDAAGAGAIIVTRGLTGGMRGMKFKRTDGNQQRPDFVVIDDPQTEESAGSQSQTEKRMRIIKRSILRLGGHNRRIAAAINATMIEEGDLTAQLLLDPAWQSMRVKMVQKEADEQGEFWLGEYAKVRQTYNPDDPLDQLRAHKDANELYQQNRERADRGCVVTWEHCFEEGEISAIQHAYNILIDDGPDVFASECQNEPRPLHDDTDLLARAEIMAKLSGYDRGVVPTDRQTLTAFIDVQGQCLYYAVCAWGEHFSGDVIDYGAFPKQRRDYFTLNSLNPTLSSKYKAAGEEGRITAGLEELLDKLMTKRWRDLAGVEYQISRCLIDQGYKRSVVHKVCSSSPHAARLYPSVGMAELARHKTPFAEYKRKPGEKTGGGYPWRLKPSEQTRSLRHLLFEPNWWKSFVHARLAVAKGDPGSLCLFGQDATAHRMLADHLLAEYRQRMVNETTGKTVDEWMIRPDRPDNHLLDCLVGCAVAASIEGVQFAEVLRSRRKTGRKRIKLSEIQAQRR